MNIGIDLGGSHIGIGIVNKEGKILNKKDIKIPIEEIDDVQEYIVDNIVSGIHELLQLSKLSLSDIGYIGIGVPGEHVNGVIIKMVNLEIQKFDIIGILKDKLQFNNIGIRNDGKCAGLAEKIYGSMKEYEDTVFLCIGSGIGGALFIDNKLVKPKRHSGFEIGHMIIKTNGNLCKCGNRGCFEAYCSINNFRKIMMNSLRYNDMPSSNFLEFLLDYQNNGAVNRLVDDYVDNLVIGLNNIVNIIEPEVITLGGGFTYFKDIFWNKLQNKFNKAEGLYNKDDIPELKFAILGNDAGIIGASIDIIEK